MASWQQTLAELARDQAGSLKRQAFLLCGNDGQAEDLVQDALVRAFARPLRAPRPGAAEAYVRVIMVNLFTPDPGAHPKAAHPRTAHVQAAVDRAGWTPPRDHPVPGRELGG
jgi:hypothetical protein